MNTIFSLPMDIYKNRRLVAKLAKNDFKTRYAGSYLGIVWAFIQPVITILVYWFVFSVGFRSGTGDLGVPFVLYLVAGIVPWFFFQDALMGGTNSLLEYNYLVKKVVFNISVLPVVKIISAMFVHAFFVLFTIILYAAYGKFPDFYYLQIIYYSVCVFILVLGLSYATSAIVIFFRDLTQIINIVLQVGVWLTPIMWIVEASPLTSCDHEDPEAESDVLYCFRIQRYIPDENLVLGTCRMDGLFLDIYNSVFPVRKLGI